VRLSKDQVALARLIDEMVHAEQRVQADLGRQFSTLNADSAQILKRVGELRYYRRFLDEARSIADDLF
jgi:hypothetical protein